MVARTNDFQAAAKDAATRVGDAGATIAEKAVEVKQTLAATGQDLVGRAGSAKDATVEAAGAVAGRAGALAHDVAEQLPRTSQEWEALGTSVRDRIRANPAPWAIGAGLVVAVWLLGRRSSR
ncbi:hypothetical protein Cme02nite_48370 [Catellatospora methionotrophica]|uniref:DUF883 domain-containing protein n=1 Tax=Catellatospora methionotrophica TaxID=121620 RepID=A0A8J3LDA6_9ACTN|nr:hypothetical protein [Catellatospora methionotrophica]GIG16505.1 hypothetical protein Cme02nite_48370 [Catellatospora methionotrophica]